MADAIKLKATKARRLWLSALVSLIRWASKRGKRRVNSLPNDEAEAYVEASGEGVGGLQ